MRYSRTETTYILGLFETGNSITIDIYDLSDDAKIVDGEDCLEIGSLGIFKYYFSPRSKSSSHKEYLWIMTKDATTKQQGKIVMGGFPDDIKNDLNNPEQYKADTSSVGLNSSTQSQINNIEEDLMSPTLDDILRYFGLGKENCIVELSYISVGNKQKISLAEIKVYANSSNCDTKSNPVNHYRLSLSYDEIGNIQKYKINTLI